MSAPTRVDGRMTRAEVIEEVEWMLEAHVHPRLIAQELGRSLGAIEKAARVCGHREVATLFRRSISEDRYAPKADAA